ncbi:MAG: hypothetical protein IPK66_15140 [Rhodospirillales bacterium]|nr:hypothetical protein [Rhodospirillales bacterium]
MPTAGPATRQDRGTDEGEATINDANGLGPLVDILFLAVTGFIACHAIRHRRASGETDTVRLLFGCIAALFFVKVLFDDLLGLVHF